MQIPDEEQVENYLRRFRPIAPKPIEKFGVRKPSRRFWAPAIWITAAAGVLILALGVWHFQTKHIVLGQTRQDGPLVGGTARLTPLTMRTADALLVSAPSFNAAIDDLAVRSGTNPIPAGKQSALSALSRE